ncbi:hypothetical protein KR093_002157 [Drosophila rubida]|uniref:Protein Wnt n=1 Tax=Drosophila rubida TaxID=30044 RepID=A0AAD4JQV7_9MUSC|nr:hypothetical protein KR093_002157 [Drosophila rubida]
MGIKSPFIEFGSQDEQLANTSIPLNITKDEQAYMHQEGLRKLGTFIKPVDLRDSETGYVKADLTKRLEAPNAQARRVHPIQEEMDQKQIILLDEDTDENGLPASLTDEDRKFIVPMALKNASPELRWGVPAKTPVFSSLTSANPTRSSLPTAARRRSTTTHTSTTIAPDPTSNIDDLKKHILFLHNMTKSDNNFESKFVKFPSLQKEKSKQSSGGVGAGGSSTTNAKRPQRPVLQYAAPIAPPTRKVPHGAHTPGQKPFGGYYHNEEESNTFVDVVGSSDGSKERNKYEGVPQVHLLGDDESTTAQWSSSTTTSTTTLPPPVESTSKRTTKRPVCLRNPESPKCVRQRQREEQQRQRERDEWFRGQAEFMPPRFEPIIQTINNTKRFAVSIEIPDSFKVHSDAAPSDEAPDLQALSRVARSQPKRRNIAAASVDKIAHSSGNYFAHDIIMTSAGVTDGREFMLANVHQFGMLPTEHENETLNAPTAAYSETINLNPDNCYTVEGLSYGQKKQCALHTSVMPAISRGARAAIQECQFQFKNRRWNCSTTEDATVFGPMTGLGKLWITAGSMTFYNALSLSIAGTPEMAFIHALAAATVTSFVARACRDGQLTSCGCSRGSRPKQLHDDWTWGGCGDNLEYAYKFATDFIDVREKETRRGTRGAGNPERRRKQMQADDAKSGGNLANVESAKSMKETKSRSNQDGKNETTLPLLYDLQSKTRKSANDSLTSVPSSSLAPPRQESSDEKDDGSEPRINSEDLIELQERITKEILNSKLKENDMIELQENINREILNSKLFNGESNGKRRKRKRKNQRAVSGEAPVLSNANIKAISLMNLHNNEAGRRAVIKKTRITCKCHGVSGSCSLITCWQQLSSIREIIISSIYMYLFVMDFAFVGDYLREKYEEATEVKLNKRGRLQVKNSQFKVPTAHDLIYLDESPDWCRTNRLLQWTGEAFVIPFLDLLLIFVLLFFKGTHGRVCNKSSSGLDGCGILCCGRGYNTKNIIVRERCNCKFHWCCQVKCDVCTKVLEEHTCK